MNNTIEVFRKVLNESFKEHGSAAEFCRKTGINRTTLERWLKYGGAPGIDVLPIISRELNIPVGRLVDDSIQELPDPDELCAFYAAKLAIRLPRELIEAIFKADDSQMSQIRMILGVGPSTNEIKGLADAISDPIDPGFENPPVKVDQVTKSRKKNA